MAKVTASNTFRLCKESGRHNAGGSLYLVVRGGSALWEYQFRKASVLRSMWLGSPRGEPSVSLAEAREKAMDTRKTNRLERKTGIAAPVPHAVANGGGGETFAEAAAKFLKAKAGSWKPSEQVRNARLLGKPVKAIADRPFTSIRPADVRDLLLQPLKRNDDAEKGLRTMWMGPSAKPGGLLRSLIEWTLDHAAVEAGMDDYSNPATLKGKLEHLLSTETAEVEHFEAMPYGEVGTFLRERNDPVLTFLVLTASRLAEVTGMPASEVEGDTWTIPGERYKTGKTHIVPLSPAAMACLPLPEGSPRARKHCLQKHMKGIEPTLHGFRSSFRDWARDVAKAPDDVAEMCLGHVVGSKVTRAYKRGDLLAERRALLDAWADYALGAVAMASHSTH
jgi:integrase